MKRENLYINNEWFSFSTAVKNRDGCRCLKCSRGSNEVVLQVHHKTYRPNKKPWEYALSDCITLCRGCHAREHNLIEPNSGWHLLSIDDLGELTGTCERHGCGNSIRYEHLTYHPQWGYKVVGSTCIEHLTEEDKEISGNAIKFYKKVSRFIDNSIWEKGVTKKGKKYLYSSYKKNEMRIYGSDNYYAIQVNINYQLSKIISARGLNFDRIKELVFIYLNGVISKKDKEKELLRKLYINSMSK